MFRAPRTLMHQNGTRGGTWTHNLFRATRSKRVTYAFRHSGVENFLRWARRVAPFLFVGSPSGAHPKAHPPLEFGEELPYDSSNSCREISLAADSPPQGHVNLVREQRIELWSQASDARRLPLSDSLRKIGGARGKSNPRLTRDRGMS